MAAAGLCSVHVRDITSVITRLFFEVDEKLLDYVTFQRHVITVDRQSLYCQQLMKAFSKFLDRCQPPNNISWHSVSIPSIYYVEGLDKTATKAPNSCAATTLDTRINVYRSDSNN